MTQFIIFAMIANLTFGVAEGLTNNFDWTAILNTSITGAVLGWFLWKHEPRSKAMEAALDRNTRATTLSVITFQSVQPAVKQQAEAILVDLAKAGEEREK